MAEHGVIPRWAMEEASSVLVALGCEPSGMRREVIAARLAHVKMVALEKAAKVTDDWDFPDAASEIRALKREDEL